MVEQWSFPMKSFIEWCQHYGYDPSNPDAKSDYQKYLEQLALFRSILDKDTEAKTDDRKQN